MKKVVFIGKEKGCITPQAQAEFLAKHGHLEGIIGCDMDKTSQTVKYYTYNCAGFKVIYFNGKVAQVIEMDADDVRKIASCSKLKFGGF